MPLFLYRLRVRIALLRADGTTEREQAIIDGYGALVEAEPMFEWPE
jgi:hypothetical protein